MTRRTRLWKAYRYVAARRAVLTPLAGMDWLASDGAAVDASMKARRRYLHRLEKYAKLGFPWYNTPEKLFFARRCPIFGVTNSRKVVTCKHPPLCPFCYARQYVIEPFQKFETLLYGGTDAIDHDRECRFQPAQGWYVIGFRNVWRIRVVPQDWNFAGLQARAETFYSSKFTNEREAIRRQCRAPFSAMLHQAFHKRGTDRVLEFRRCGVMLTRHYQPVEALVLHKERDWSGIWPANKKNLCEAFGRAMAYPIDLMTAAAPIVLDVQRAFGNRRRFFWSESKTDRPVPPHLVPKAGFGDSPSLEPDYAAELFQP